MLEVTILDAALDDRATPELALVVGAAPERQDDRKRDLSLAEIVADAFSQSQTVARIIERVIDELEGDSEVLARRSAVQPVPQRACW